MIDCVIYTLFAHNWDCLEEQSISLDRYAKDCGVVIVEDGDYPCGILDQDTLHVFPDTEMPPIHHRSKYIALKLLETIVPKQKERYAIFMHGDMFAIRPFTAKELFAGKTHIIAGIRPRGRVKYKWAGTQLLGIDTAKSSEAHWGKWDYEQIQIYPVRHEVIISERKYIEWIGPFKHLTSMGGTKNSYINPLP